MYRRSMLSAAIAMALTIGGATGFAQPAPQVRTEPARPSKRATFRSAITGERMNHGTKGVSITMAQQKRNSRKAKNVKRHRAACRG